MSESLATFSAIVLAIFLEAMPFLALGSLLAAAIEVFVPPDGLIRYVPTGTGAGIAVGLVAGMLMPTCECGVVPVVRRLMRKGVPVHVAVAYMLSAPIINPVVLASTWIAFQGDSSMVTGRMMMAAAIAAILAMAAHRMSNILIMESRGLNEAVGCCHHDHGHRQIIVAGSCPQPAHPTTLMEKLKEVLHHGGQEFINMGQFLILGAIVAALFKTFLPKGVFLAFTGSPALQVVGMMVLAILLSVCSEADAFVAASFQLFSASSQLAFVTIGPMIDLKLIGMYAATFGRSFFWTLMIVPVVLVFAFSMLFGMIP
jgi:uncharacterized membrane protein YraQ (UPF0718 family)